MSYQSLYRKFRPRTFDDIVGQHHITTILKNQIQTGRSAHAYLFCGSRGTGKTSTAKIFARAINCSHPVDGEACGACPACEQMAADDVDIIEIDAASNNGVDDMRTLIDQARFTPLRLQYKVYIIDEVHMLSNSASNALLKTLEEPPQHIKFLLATTEPQKLLPTVISRCQRFDFKRLTLPDIMQTMRTVLQSIHASMEEGGLYAIARAADGGLRDALSLLDQCLAFCGENVREQDVYDVLGSMNGAFFFEITSAIIESNAQHVLLMLDSLVRNGRNLSVFVQDLAQHMRALLMAQVCGDCTEMLECTQEDMARYAAQAALCPQPRLLRALERISATQRDMKWLSQPRILVEAMLVAICRPEDETSLLALEDRLISLELAAERQPVVRSIPSVAQADHMPQEALIQNMPQQKSIPPQATVAQDALPGTQAQEEPQLAAGESLEETPESRMLWDSLRKALQKNNASLYVLSAGALSAVLQQGSLIVTFPKAKESPAKSLALPQKRDVMQAILQGISPGTVLNIQVEGARQPGKAGDADEQELLRIFGDKLSIEE